jgi:hypothetical protein
MTMDERYRQAQLNSEARAGAGATIHGLITGWMLVMASNYVRADRLARDTKIEKIRPQV